MHAGERSGRDALVHPRGGNVEVGREAAHIPERLPERLLGTGLRMMANSTDLGDDRRLLFFGHDVTRAGTSASNDELSIQSMYPRSSLSSLRMCEGVSLPKR